MHAHKNNENFMARWTENSPVVERGGSDLWLIIGVTATHTDVAMELSKNSGTSWSEGNNIKLKDKFFLLMIIKTATSWQDNFSDRTDNYYG